MFLRIFRRFFPFVWLIIAPDNRESDPVMTDCHTEKDIRDWLGTPDALELIHRVAVAYIRFAARHGLPAGSDSRFEPNGQAAKENLQSIESELVLFILENRTGFQRKLLLENRKKGEFLKSAFICFQRENARHKDTDTFRYLYKRTGDILRNDSRFYTDTGPSGAMDFCMQPHGRRMAPLMAEDVEAILFPHDRIECHDFKSINRKKIIIQLATCFWRQVSDMWGKTAVRIDVRDLVKWIDRHIPVGIPQPISLTGAISDTDAPEAPRMDMEIPDPHSPPEDGGYDREQIQQWACDFSRLLGEKEKKVFFLRYNRQLDLGAIAGRTGYKGASGPKYILDEVERKLKHFLQDRPWLSPDEEQEMRVEAFDLFLNSLFLLLKKTI